MADRLMPTDLIAYIIAALVIGVPIIAVVESSLKLLEWFHVPN
jgi:hypothetical protein